jgi:hypothetical protein
MQKQAQPEKDKKKSSGNPTRSDLRNQAPKIDDLLDEIDKVLEERVQPIKGCTC